MNSNNLKEQISEILNKVSLYASDWNDDDSDDGLTVKEATNQILELVVSKVGDELNGTDRYCNGWNDCREAMLDNLGIKEQLDE